MTYTYVYLHIYVIFIQSANLTWMASYENETVKCEISTETPKFALTDTVKLITKCKYQGYCQCYSISFYIYYLIQLLCLYRYLKHSHY